MITLPVEIPANYSITVKVGDTVEIGQALATKKTASDILIDLSKLFGKPAKKLKDVLLKNPGDYVSLGEVIAKSGGFLGSKQIESNVDGTIVRYEEETGVIAIRPKNTGGSGPTQITSPLDGKVTMCNNNSIQIQTDKNVLLGSKGGGGMTRAVVHVLPQNKRHKEEVSALDLTPELIGTIVLGSTFGKETVAKAAGIGIAGVIGTTIPKTVIEYLSDKQLNLPTLEVDDEVFQKIAKREGKELFLNGATKTILLLGT